MKKKLLIHFVCVVMSFYQLLHSKNTLDFFAKGLQLIQNESWEREQNNKKFEDEFEKLIQNQGPGKTILASSDSIYQIQAPDQEKIVGCGFLTFRNAYNLLDALENNNFIEFIQKYHTVKNPEQFCDIRYEGGVKFAVMRNANLEKKFEPLKNKIVYFYSFDPRIILRLNGVKKDPLTKEYQNIYFHDLQKIIDDHENINAEEIIIRAALIKASDEQDYAGYRALKENIKKLHERKDYFFALITTTKTIEAHAVLLIIHKINGIIRYYFIDPPNYIFNDTKQKFTAYYRTSINRLKIFIEQPLQLDNAIVRYLRYKYKDNDTEFKKAIKNEGLETNEIYRTFYA